MKLPKSRDIIYLVVRWSEDKETSAPIAVFRTPERADEYAGACDQEMADHGATEFLFTSQAVIYYNE
jgi:hypothetical protein